MTKKICGEQIVREATSREGTVYLTVLHAYKVFGGRTNAYDELEKYKTAENNGVPVPDTVKFTGELQDGGAVTTVGGLRSKLAVGRFFQLSKPGGEAALINEINLMTNRELLKMVATGLTNAGNLGIGDPQGFLATNSNPPITFIDLHLAGRPTPVSFQGALLAAQSRLQALG